MGETPGTDAFLAVKNMVTGVFFTSVSHTDGSMFSMLYHSFNLPFIPIPIPIIKIIYHSFNLPLIMY
jgi:hypothetical protein